MIISCILISDEIQLMCLLIPLKEMKEFGEHVYLNKCFAMFGRENSKFQCQYLLKLSRKHLHYWIILLKLLDMYLQLTIVNYRCIHYWVFLEASMVKWIYSYRVLACVHNIAFKDLKDFPIAPSSNIICMRKLSLWVNDKCIYFSMILSF